MRAPRKCPAMAPPCLCRTAGMRGWIMVCRSAGRCLMRGRSSEEHAGSGSYLPADLQTRRSSALLCQQRSVETCSRSAASCSQRPTTLRAHLRQVTATSAGDQARFSPADGPSSTAKTRDYKERTAGKFYLLGCQYRCLGVGLRPRGIRRERAQVTVYLQTTATGALIGAGRRAAARDDQTVDTSPPAAGMPSVPGHSAQVRSSNTTAPGSVAA